MQPIKRTIHEKRRRIKLADLRKQAELLGVVIVAVRDDYGWGYWLENTGWDDDNFCSSHSEIQSKLNKLAK